MKASVHGTLVKGLVQLKKKKKKKEREKGTLMPSGERK